MKRPLSVVMPVFDGERFVGAAIDSILTQTFGDFDFHIVDDGSTDGTAAILARYAGSDRRIVVHTQPRNSGITSALNLGCRAASGDLIARMDADDISLPERFERQIRFLEEHADVGVLGTCVRVIDEHGQLGAVWPCPSQPGLTAWSLLFTCIVAHPTVMMRRAVLERAGYYPVGYAIGQDYALWMRLVKLTRIANLEQVLVHYREVSTSLSRAGFEQAERAWIRTFQETVDDLPIGAVSAADIRMLRAFARHRYPLKPHEISRLADLIASLRAYLVALQPFSPADVRAINTDAGVRLWLLSVLALRSRSPLLAARLALRALRASPSSIVPFTGKVIRKLKYT
jgi:glycosyltransferase involved in cell wall biosynthesis